VVQEAPQVISTMELPEGARLSDSDDDDGRPQTDPHRALDIDLEGYLHFFNSSKASGYIS